MFVSKFTKFYARPAKNFQNWLHVKNMAGLDNSHGPFRSGHAKHRRMFNAVISYGKMWIGVLHVFTKLTAKIALLCKSTNKLFSNLYFKSICISRNKGKFQFEYIWTRPEKHGQNTAGDVYSQWIKSSKFHGDSCGLTILIIIKKSLRAGNTLENPKRSKR